MDKNGNGVFTDVTDDKRDKLILLRLSKREKAALDQLARGQGLRKINLIRKLLKRELDASTQTKT